jgi:hypothetical protein
MEIKFLNFEFRDIITKIVSSWKKNQISHLFYDGDYIEQYQENIQRLVKKYPVFTHELLDMDFKIISISKEIIPLKFIVDLQNENIGDTNKLFLIKYIFEKFETKDIQKYNLYIAPPKEADKWFEYITFLSNYDFIDVDKFFSSSNFSSYIDSKLKYSFQKAIKLDKEKKELQNENSEMKKRIQELELQIKYMPDGQEYLEAEKRFNLIKIN